MLVDRLGNRRRLERAVVVRGIALPGIRRVGDQCCPSESNPQLGSPPRPHLVCAGNLVRILFDQLQAVVGKREEAHVLPDFRQALGVLADRFFCSHRIDRECGERRRQLIAGDSANELDGSDVVFVESLRQLLEDRIQGIGRNSFDDQLPAGNADGKRIAVPGEQRRHSGRDTVHRDIQQGMARRINRVLVERDGQLDQEVRQLARQRRHCRLGGRGRRRGGSGRRRCRSRVGH